MTKMTKEILAQIENGLKSSDNATIKEIIEDYGDSLGDVLKGIENEVGLESVDDYVPSLLEYVDQGHQGDGTEAYLVVRHKPTGMLVGFDGWYASHYGYEFEYDELKEMEPFTVTHYRGK